MVMHATTGSRFVEMRSPSASLVDRRRRAVLLAAAAQQPLILPLAAPAVDKVPTPTKSSLSDRTQLPLATFGLQIYDDATALERRPAKTFEGIFSRLLRILE